MCVRMCVCVDVCLLMCVLGLLGRELRGYRGSSREMECCQEEGKEDVLGEIEATPEPKNPSGCSF